MMSYYLFINDWLALCTYSLALVQIFSAAPASLINKHVDINRIKSIINDVDNEDIKDATVIPLKKIILSTLDFNINEDDKIKLTYTTNFGSEELSTSSYTQFTNWVMTV